MKLFLMFFLAGLSAVYLHAAGILVSQAPISGYGAPVSIAISSTTLTKVPSSQTVGRFGVYLNNPATNAADVAGFFGDCSSASYAASIRPVVISTRSYYGASYVPMRDDVCLWLTSLNTAAATMTIHYQEVKQ